jgi:geranylgeranyl pyrophosphate synthase
MPPTVLNRIDDVEDNSELRRGIPVAHKIYGVASTINSANYVYVLFLSWFTSCSFELTVLTIGFFDKYLVTFWLYKKPTS